MTGKGGWEERERRGEGRKEEEEEEEKRKGEGGTITRLQTSVLSHKEKDLMTQA